VELWWYRATLDRRADLSPSYADGDTVRVLLDQGTGSRQSEDLRLLGVSAPEINDPGGLECRGFLLDFIASAPAWNWPLLCRTVPNTNPEPTQRRSFVRYMADIWHLDRYDGAVAVAGRHLNGELRAFLALHSEWGSGS
jgi:hypothetical protein